MAKRLTCRSACYSRILPPVCRAGPLEAHHFISLRAQMCPDDEVKANM